MNSKRTLKSVLIQDIPTGAVKNYEVKTDSDGLARIKLFAEEAPDSPQGEAAALRLEQDPRVADAALVLLTTVERWSKPELPISSCLDPGNAPSSTRAIVVSLTDAVNHPIKLTKPSLGVVS